MTELLPFCECGCGERVMKPGNQFILGHNQQNIPHTPETCAKISKTKTGVPNSSKHNAAISKGQRGIPPSPEHRAALSKAHAESDVMRGGNDIVNHHYIYDHNDLPKYTTEMTRSQHTSLHNNLRLLGLEVPHINTGNETEDELKLMEYIKKIESEPKGL